MLGAKYERILTPIAALVLEPDQAALVAKPYMQNITLFHELSHSLGPGTITIGGQQTTVSEVLKEQYTALEEAKADTMGVWNILLMMKQGELPAAQKPQLFATYFAGLFRAMRFGTLEAHGRGAALQYGYLADQGAFAWDDTAGRYVIDESKMETGLRNLLHDQLMLQATGDYARTIAFFDSWAKLDNHAETAVARMTDIPVDILPVYPDRI